jgi:hypothetical protein
MKRNLRIGLPVLAVAAALIVAGVLLATTPWSGDTPVREAAAAPTEYSLCNISITNVPEDVAVGEVELPVPPNEQEIYLVASVAILTEGLPAAPPGVTPTPVLGRILSETINEEGEWIESHIVFDPQTGAIVEEYYNPERPADKAKLEVVKNSVVVGGPGPGAPAWPRTDTPPRLDKIQSTPPVLGYKGLKYRPPEAGSGLLVSHIQGSGDGLESQRVRARTCESVLVIQVDEVGRGAIVVDDVVPEEQAMFDRFMSQVEGLEE